MKRSSSDSILYDENNNKKQKLSTTTNKSCLENLANELIYEIFDYLDINDIYFGFFYLNNRFQNLYLNSNNAFQLNLSNISKEDFEYYHKNVLEPNKNRIKILYLTNPFTIDLIFSPPRLISTYNQIEKLIFDNIHSKYLINILKHLICLPKLHSLTLSSIDYIENPSILFIQICRLTKLKSCQLTYRTKETKLIDFNQCQQSSIENFIINGNFPYESLEKFLVCFPKLHSLSINRLVRLNYLTEKDFNPIELKNLKSISFELHSIYFELLKALFKNFFQSIEILTISIYNDNGSNFFDGEQWEELISTSIPKLRIFDFQHHYSGAMDHFLYACHSGDFRSEFWTNKQCFFHNQVNNALKCGDALFFTINPYRRKTHEFYWEHDYMTRSNIQEDSFRSVKQISIHGTETYMGRSVYFPNVNELTIHDYGSISTSLNKILPLHQLNKLIINSKKFRFKDILNLINVTSNLKTFKWYYHSIDEDQLKLIEQSDIYQCVLNNNKIENFEIIHYCCSLKEILFFSQLFSKLKTFQIEIINKEFISIMRYLLLKMSHLVFLCIKELPKTYSNKLNILIKSDNLLEHYFIKFINRDLYLWY
ncbi:unnamed protein product [Adineta steineri]|uniref:F-box domain-containing protein n=2 Tax=Adineta steineri TaxID=433720 RepID=A0A813V7Y4_9BILA|nr:unnamed protein product [Adineta steineri]